MEKDGVKAKVKFGEFYRIVGYIGVWETPGSEVDASVWGEYSRDLDKEIITAIFNKLGMEKEVIDKQATLTSGDLEKLRRFKSVDEAIRSWLGKRPAAQGTT